MNILIVENSPRMRRTIRSVLAGLAHEVFECEDGNQALAAYQTHRPDWVLMDIGLKEVDGIVATGILKTAFPEAKVVIVTDYDDVRLRQAAQHAGACAYVLKEDLFELRVVIKTPDSGHANLARDHGRDARATPETEAMEQHGRGTKPSTY